MTQNPSPEIMMQALHSFIRAETRSEKEAYLAKHPELLTDEASEALSRLIEEEENQDTIHILTQHRDLLAQARQKGLDEAFAEFMPTPSASTNPLLPLLEALIACNSTTAVLELAAQHPSLLSDEMMLFLQILKINLNYSFSHNAKESANHIEQCYEILRQVRKIMDETGMSVEEVVQAVRTSPKRSSQPQSSSYQQVSDAVLVFLYAKSWDESKRIVEQERELLLSDMALRVFADLLEQYKDNAKAIRTVTEHRDLLILAFKEGIEVAFVGRTHSQKSLYGTISEEVNTLIAKIQTLTHGTDMPRRIELCHRALKQVARDAQTQLWAALQVELGNSYTKNPLGERADNLEQAIHHYQQALEVFTRQAAPLEWARTENNLGNAYYLRIKGGRSDNIEQAIQHYCEALTVRTRQAWPVQWAETINNLANAYSDRIKGKRNDNIELVIQHFREALTVRTRQARPVQWARTLNNLANTYKNRIKGERADNIELAIQYFREALTVRTRQALPIEWAETLNNLAEAYSDRIKGERADNIELAIQHYCEALTITTYKAFPVEWAKTLNKLANAYCNRIKRERGDNIELAIEHYCEALTVRTRQAWPIEWAETINNLAAAYYYRIKGERGDNIELAIEHYREALTVRTRQTLLVEWAKTIHDLGLAYYYRIKGERGDNIELAIQHFHDVLTVITHQAFPAEWAKALNNLGAAYWSRIKGERADNIELTIQHYREALTVRTRQAWPIEWAETLNNLAIAYSEIKEERGDNIELAISYYKQALKVRTRQALPIEWGQTIHNLANAYCERIKGERADNIEIAISCYSQALELFQPETLPYDCRRTAYSLGRLLYDEGRFAFARDVFAMAHEAVEFMRDEAVRVDTRERLAKENAEIYARLVYCCLAVGDEASAFKYAAAGKGRAFVDLLSSAQIDLSNLPDKDNALQDKVVQARELKRCFDELTRQLLGEIPSINTHLTSQNAIPELSKAQRQALLANLERLRQEDKKLWEEIRQQFPDYFATQSAEPFTLVEAHALGQQLDATLISYYRHHEGWVAFVIRPDVAFDSALSVVALPVTTEQLIKSWQGFNNKLSTGAFINLHWSQKLSDALIAPLLDHLPSPVPNNGGYRLVIAPFLLLHLLPFASLPRTPMPWREAGLPQVKYLLDEYEVAITPSLAMGGRVMDRRQRGEKRDTLCAIAYPGHKGSKHYLAHVLPEAEAIAPLFTHSTTRLDDAATREAAIQDVYDVDVAHYSCHGLFDREEVEQSSLLLADEMLTLRDIFNDVRLPNASLVTLSACETGLASVRQGDELAGMVQGFVYAGTPAVVASLWAVDDAATRYLFQRFYERYTTGMAASHALRTAQQELRQNGYPHPYYWAAFQAVGAAYDSLPTSGRAIRPAQQVIQPPTASQKKGIDPMNTPNPQAILTQAEELLQQIEPFATPISQQLTSEERSTFIGTLQTLISQTSHITSQSELIQLASRIISAFEAIPLLRDFLLGNIDPTTEQQKRHLTIQSVEEATKHLPSSHQEPQKTANTYGKMMSDVVQLLQEKKEKAQKESKKPE